MSAGKPESCPPVAAVVLAAGESRRMGDLGPKPLLRLPDGRTFLVGVVAAARAAGIDDVVVVVGYHAGSVRAVLPAGVRAAVNDAPERGMLSSIRAGLDALPPGVSGALVWPIDHPRVPAGVVAALVARFRSTEQAPPPPVVLPTFGGRRGHPALFAARLFDELRAAPLAEGARAVVRAHARDVAEVAVDSPAVLEDVDTPVAYRRLLGA